MSEPTHSGTCFSITPYSSPFDEYYTDIVEPAVEDAELKPVRGDSVFRPGTVMEHIWQGIQEADVLVAELTGMNANVYYELGLAHALGKPVVLMSADQKDVPFDLRALRHILYDKNDPAWGAKLRTELTQALTTARKNPKGAIPSAFKTTVPSQAPEEREVITRLSRVEERINALINTLNPAERERPSVDVALRELDRALQFGSYSRAKRAVKQALELGVSDEDILGALANYYSAADRDAIIASAKSKLDSR